MKEFLKICVFIALVPFFVSGHLFGMMKAAFLCGMTTGKEMIDGL